MNDWMDRATKRIDGAIARFGELWSIEQWKRWWDMELERQEREQFE